MTLWVSLSEWHVQNMGSCMHMMVIRMWLSTAQHWSQASWSSLAGTSHPAYMHATHWSSTPCTLQDRCRWQEWMKPIWLSLVKCTIAPTAVAIEDISQCDEWLQHENCHCRVRTVLTDDSYLWPCIGTRESTSSYHRYWLQLAHSTTQFIIQTDTLLAYTPLIY